MAAASPIRATPALYGCSTHESSDPKVAKGPTACARAYRSAGRSRSERFVNEAGDIRRGLEPAMGVFGVAEISAHPAATDVPEKYLLPIVRVQDRIPGIWRSRNVLKEHASEQPPFWIVLHREACPFACGGGASVSSDH